MQANSRWDLIQRLKGKIAYVLPHNVELPYKILISLLDKIS